MGYGDIIDKGIVKTELKGDFEIQSFVVDTPGDGYRCKTMVEELGPVGQAGG
jgi:hypothetical protein